MQFTLQPHRGIGPISFGMNRNEVAMVMGGVGGGRPVPRSVGEETDCYFDNFFQVSFEDAGRADFIEVSSGLAATVLFDGQDVFDLPADELLALIGRHDRPDPELSEPPDSYIFPDLILSLWGRDEQYDHKGGGQRPVFAAVGLGAPSYLAAIRAIRDHRPAQRTA